MLFALQVFGQRSLTPISLGLHSNPDTVKIRQAEIYKIFSSSMVIITINSVGCFHGITETYQLSKNDTFYKVTYYTKTYSDTVRNCQLFYKISKSDFRKIRGICLRGPGLSAGGCTTENSFCIQNKIMSTNFIDGRCAGEDDLSFLLRKLVGIKCPDAFRN